MHYGPRLHGLVGEVDVTARRGVCKHCGPVDIKKNRGDWRCATADRRRTSRAPLREEIAARQNGCCAICGVWQEKLCLDHCHETGKQRDGLCSNCNAGLGFFKDNPNRLRMAADYIECHRSS